MSFIVLTNNLLGPLDIGFDEWKEDGLTAYHFLW